MSQQQAITQQKIQRELNKQKISKLFKFATKQGVIKQGWSFIDYARDSINRHGWESTCISGPKGTLKSNLLMQHGLAIYGDETTVIDNMITEKKQLIDKLQYAINNEICIPWIGVDDIAALFPKSLYFTHRKLYSKLQATWETVRTVMSNFEFSCVLKHKVSGFIMEDITGDIKCYNPSFMKKANPDDKPHPIKCHYDYRRWMWLRNLKDPTTDIAKLILVEDTVFPATPDSFKHDKELNQDFIFAGQTYPGYEYFEKILGLKGIETRMFRDYWNRRLAITKTSFEDFVGIWEDIEEKEKQKKLSQEERSEINKANGARGLETQKQLRNNKKHGKSGEVAN